MTLRPLIILLLICTAAPSSAARRWKVISTPSFRVMYFDAAVARKVARKVELLRAEQFKLWGGAAPKLWRPRCDVYIYSSNRDLVRMTGGSSKAGSAQSRASRLSPGRMLQRRINVAATDRALLGNTLPHEITHVVAADLLGGKVPRWANEGMAVLSEQMSSIKYYDAILQRALARGRWFPLKRLMAMRRYPKRPYLGLYYAQSASLVLFFVSQKSNATFIQFLRDAGRRGVPTAVRQHYGMSGYADLQRRWLKATRQ